MGTANNVSGIEEAKSIGILGRREEDAVKTFSTKTSSVVGVKLIPMNPEEFYVLGDRQLCEE